MVLAALDESQDTGHDKGADLVALSDALTALASFDARMGQVVELAREWSMSKRGTIPALKDILEAGGRIERYVGSMTESEFLGSTRRHILFVYGIMASEAFCHAPNRQGLHDQP